MWLFSPSASRLHCRLPTHAPLFRKHWEPAAPSACEGRDLTAFTPGSLERGPLLRVRDSFPRARPHGPSALPAARCFQLFAPAGLCLPVWRGLCVFDLVIFCVPRTLLTSRYYLDVEIGCTLASGVGREGCHPPVTLQSETRLLLSCAVHPRLSLSSRAPGSVLLSLLCTAEAPAAATTCTHPSLFCVGGAVASLQSGSETPSGGCVCLCVTEREREKAPASRMTVGPVEGVSVAGGLHLCLPSRAVTAPVLLRGCETWV